VTRRSLLQADLGVQAVEAERESSGLGFDELDDRANVVGMPSDLLKLMVLDLILEFAPFGCSSRLSDRRH